jgi:hypothetical protein
MRLFKPVFAGLLPLFLVGGPSLAQQPAPTATDAKKPTEEDKKKLREKALLLLDETLADTQALTIPTNRIVLLAEILPCLWERDPVKARETATTLVTTIANQEGQPSTTDEDDFAGRPTGLRGNLDGNFRLYTQAIDKIGEADAQAALDLLTATRGRMTATHPDRVKTLDDLAQTMEIALVWESPEKLYEIARRNLDKDDFWNAITLVPTIAERDPALAGKLFSEIVSKNAACPEEEFIKISRFLQLAELLPREKDTKTPKGSSKPVESPAKGKLVVDDNQRRALFVAFGQAVLNLLKANPDADINGGYGPDVNTDQVCSYLPEFQKYAPRVAEQLKKKMSQSEEAANAEIDSENDLLKRLEQNKLDSDEMDYVIQRIFPKLLADGRMEEARKVIEKTADPAMRERLTRQLESIEALKTAENDKTSEADAARLLEQAKTGGQRFRLLLAFAEKAVAQKDEKRAAGLLDQALVLTGRIQNPRDQMISRMAVAAQFVKFAPNRALDIYEPMVDKFNEFLGGAAIIGGYLEQGGSETVQGNEFDLESSSGIVGLLPLKLIPLGLIAKADFDRTRALIDRVRFPEIRARLRMEILKAVLLPEEPPTETPADAPTTAEKKPETAP